MDKNFYMKIGLGVVTLWDTITTIYGTSSIIGNGLIQMILSIGFGLVLAVFLIRTIPIMKNPENEDLIVIGTKFLWVLAIAYDLFTSFTGNHDLILGNVEGIQKNIIAVGLTIFVSSAPIGLSSLIYQNKV